jgi:hypothetical protein
MSSGPKTIELITEFSKNSSPDYKSLNKCIQDLCKENGLNDDTAIPKISEADYKTLEKMFAKLGNKNIALSFESFRVEHIELNKEPFSFAAYIEHLRERY